MPRPSLLALAAAAAAAAPTAAGRAPSTDPRISHVVVLMLENRAFDHILGWMAKYNNSAIRGLTGAESNVDPVTNITWHVTDAAPWVEGADPDHGVPGTATQIYGTATPPDEHNPAAVNMGGFIRNEASVHGDGWAPKIMDCFHPANVPVLSTLASEFALLDTSYASVPGPTYPNRLFMMSGTSWGYGTNSVNQTAAGWPQKSLFRALAEEGNATWREYWWDLPIAAVLSDMRTLPALANFRDFVGNFVKDALAGDLPQFTHIEPAYYTIDGVWNASDEHPPHNVLEGEFLIKTVYEALRAGPLWNETLLVITFDEHGGNFDGDHMPVTGVPSPDGIPCRDCSKTPLNFTRLGVRVPTVLVSPWIPAGTVVHAPAGGGWYDSTSLPATVRQLFGVTAPLTARDAAATTFSSVWTDAALPAPRTDCPTTLAYIPPSAAPGVERLRGSARRPTAQQRDLTFAAEALRQAVAEGDAVDVGARVAAIHAALDAAGALETEDSAGRYARAAVQEAIARARRGVGKA